MKTSVIKALRPTAHRATLLLLILLLAAALAGCGGGGDNKTPGTDTSVPGITGTEQNEDGLTVTSGGAARLTIIRPDGAATTVVDSAVSLSAELENLTGVRVKISDDYKKDSGEPEILIGKTNRDDSTDTVAQLKNEYTVRIADNKLIVVGDTDRATSRAVIELIDALEGFVGKDGSIVIPRDFTITGSCRESMLDEIPEFTGGTTEEFYPGNGSQMLCVSGTTEDAVVKYAEKLGTSGYDLVAARTVKNNKFYTYANRFNIVTLVYIGYDKSARIICDRSENTVLPTQGTADRAESVCEPIITMLGLEYSYAGKTIDDAQNGMSFVCRLDDGSFIIIDGGFKEDESATRLYRLLQKQAPDPDNIVIAAWILTHAHNDHIGTMLRFSELYSAKVTVELFIHDFPAAEQAKITGDGGEAASCAAYMDKYEGASVMLARPGQLFKIHGMTVEMLYTTELYNPKDLTYFNTSSLVFRLTAQTGESFMVLGDCSEESNDVISRMYEGYLKSDIVQVAHHGSQGGSYRLYMYIEPVYVLWPRGLLTFDNSISNSRNAYFKSAKNVKGIWCAGSTVTVYELGKSTVTVNKSFEDYVS